VALFMIHRLYGSLRENDKNIILETNKEHYVGVAKYLFHFILVGGLLVAIIYFQSFWSCMYLPIAQAYDFNSHPSSIIAIALVLYLIMTVISPSIKLNFVFRDAHIEYTDERNNVWGKKKYEGLMNLKENINELNLELEHTIENL